MDYIGTVWKISQFGYHLNKLKEVEEKGYRLIQIWEQNWLFKQEKIKEHLISIFENREIIPTNIEYLDRDLYLAPKNSEIILSEIEEIEFNNMYVQFQRTGYFKNSNFKN